jgi:hypothetical protein
LVLEQLLPVLVIFFHLRYISSFIFMVEALLGGNGLFNSMAIFLVGLHSYILHYLTGWH